MAVKYMLRHQPFPMIFCSWKPFSVKPSFLTFCSVSSSETLNLNQDFAYGPSLRKGLKPYDLQDSSQLIVKTTTENNEGLIERDRFTRVFEVSAIRVPAEECFALEKRLRGHLLNWPKVRNIARVPGDEMEDEFKSIFRRGVDNEENSDALDRRIYGESESGNEFFNPILYRDKLVKNFNCRGFLKFRHLAKVSRPKTKRKSAGEKNDQKERINKNDSVKIEIIEEEEIDDSTDLSGLLGEEFKARKWRGSTRLLLLDERLAGRGIEDFPEAVKAVITSGTCKKRTSVIELVKCKLTLFYNYWQMNEILEELLPSELIIPTTFETVGHIAHLNLRDEHIPFKKTIAQVVLDKHRPKIQTVVNKIDSIQNDYRTMKLEVLVGNHSLVTMVVENGIRFHLDLATVYWNSRLSTERQRLVNSFTSTDIVCDVFAGVGPIAISAAKKVKHVYANDLNPVAVEYVERNIMFNKLDRRIEAFNMDGRRFIHAMFRSRRSEPITQVVMNLPNAAVEFLDAFRAIFRGRPRNTTLPKIHVYGFSRAQDPDFDFLERIKVALSVNEVDVEMHKVRLVAPGKWMLCASFSLPEFVAFASIERSEDE